MRRIHRPTTIPLRGRVAPLLLASLLAIHRRAAKSIASGTLLRVAIALVRRIHWPTSAILRRIRRSTLPVALRLFAAWSVAIAQALHFWTALRLSHVVRAWSIAFPMFVCAR